MKYDPIFSYLFTILAGGSVVAALLIAFQVLRPLSLAQISVLLLLIIAVTLWDARERLSEPT